MLKIFLSLLLLQATGLMAEECADEEIETQKITEPNALLGNWSVVYAWTGETTLRNTVRSSECFNVAMVKVTSEEISAKKRECKNSHVHFDYDNVILKVVVPDVTSPDRLVSHDGHYGYVQQSCDVVTKAEPRRVNDNYVVMTYPDFDHIGELLSRVVPESEDLNCVARNIDVVKNWTGISVCSK